MLLSLSDVRTAQDCSSHFTKMENMTNPLAEMQEHIYHQGFHAPIELGFGELNIIVLKSTNYRLLIVSQKLILNNREHA